MFLILKILYLLFFIFHLIYGVMYNVLDPLISLSKYEQAFIFGLISRGKVWIP